MFLYDKSRTRTFIVYTPVQKRNRLGNWGIYLHEINKVFYDKSANVTADDVKKSLIDHDGFSGMIEVIEE
jgi:hypothetical protein